jgi:hypothetical protein
MNYTLGRMNENGQKNLTVRQVGMNMLKFTVLPIREY